MAVAQKPTLLASPRAEKVHSANGIKVVHVQLRDLLVCTSSRLLGYVDHHSVAHQNLALPQSPPQTLASLSFTPNTLSSLSLPESGQTLLAAGGQEAEVHFSTYSANESSADWRYQTRLSGSINNSVSLSLGPSSNSSLEPRVAVSNNDQTVRFFDVPIRSTSPPPDGMFPHCGLLELDAPVNHSSLSPDGRTLLAVGDTNKVSLSRVSGSDCLSFDPISTLTLPTPTFFSPVIGESTPRAPFRSSTPSSRANWNDPFRIPSSGNFHSPYHAAPPFRHSSTPTALTASFSADFSSSGMQFAVASQEGLVAVWDVRSSKVLKVFETEPRENSSKRSRSSSPSSVGGATSWVSDYLCDDPFDWTQGYTNAPGWSVRCLKFGGARGGKELMAFTEHTDRLHVVDARTFDTEEVVTVPTPVQSSKRRRIALSSTSHRHRRRPSSQSIRSSGSAIINSQRPQLSSTMSDQTLIDVLQALETDAVSSAVSTVSQSDSPTSTERSSYPSLNSDPDSEFARNIASLQNSMRVLIDRLRSRDSSSELDEDLVREAREVQQTAERVRAGRDSMSSSSSSSSTIHRGVAPNAPFLPEIEPPMSEANSLPFPRSTPPLSRSIFRRTGSGDLGSSRQDLNNNNRASSSTSSQTALLSAELDSDVMFIDDRGIDNEFGGREDMGCDMDDERELTQIQEEMDLDTNGDDDDAETVINVRQRSSSASAPPLDLAGLCFDPNGSRIYVGSKRGIAEYRILGADTSWWGGGSWA